jgi:hypothetical protein
MFLETISDVWKVLKQLFLNASKQSLKMLDFKSSFETRKLKSQ